MKQPSNCKVKDCEIRNIVEKLWPYYRVKLWHAIWNRKVDTCTEKKMQLESFSLTKLSNAGALEYALQDAPQSTFLWHNGAYSIMIRFL